jgi:phosphoribosylformylglycinamidine synthase
VSEETSESRWRVAVTVLPKAGVNDPAGESIRHGLEQLGYDGVDTVRAGKVITLVVQAESEDLARATVERMGEQLLANPVIETFSVDVEPFQART